MKSSENKPLSHHIHNLMYRKQDEINRLYSRNVVLYEVVVKKRHELNLLEDRFARQIAWERSKQ